MSKKATKQYVKDCIDCGALLGAHNIKYLWQRRCNWCVGIIENKRDESQKRGRSRVKKAD
jgi:hypothetical protein